MLDFKVLSLKDSECAVVIDKSNKHVCVHQQRNLALAESVDAHK